MKSELEPAPHGDSYAVNLGSGGWKQVEDMPKKGGLECGEQSLADW